jgi:serpin B
MASGPLHNTLVYLRRLAAPGEAGALSDAELLERFVRHRDEAAFEVLVWRHGPLVLGVCRRVLRHAQDAEDAFQAAFLTLARKAHTVGKRPSVGSWLYKVAYRIALAARARAARTQAEPPPAELPAAPTADDLLWRDLRPVLDEEVNRLPEKYRTPVLLCYLQGLTHEEAARQVGCPPSTLSVRLMRARERLRARLTSRGLAPCVGLLATALAERASAAVGGPQVSATVKAALAFAAGAGGPTVSPAAAVLARGALRTMLMARIRNVGLALAVGLLAALVGVLTYHSLEAAPPAPQQKAVPQPPQPVARPAEWPKATPADVAAAVEGNTRFALDLYKRLRAKEGNLFLSPYSVSTAFAMTYAGARGDTAAQMAKALHITLDQPKLPPALAELAARLKGDGKKRDFELTVANALWGQKGAGFLPEFLELNRTFYGAGLQKVDFVRAAEEARKTINAWTEKQTQGRIKDLLQPGTVNPATRLVLTNAVYFKAAWDSPFYKKATRVQPFRVSADRTVKVPMMRHTIVFRYLEDDQLQAVELPYKGKEVSMLILLPRKADGLAELEGQLTHANLGKWLSGMRRAIVSVSLPRFEVTGEFSLKQVLSDMGMPLAFTARAADFSGMESAHQFFLQNAVHKTFVRVDEEGTEAAGATAVLVGAGGFPKAFRADHPFLFLVRDNRSGSVLFLGRVVEPR